MKNPTILTVVEVSEVRKDKREKNYRNITVRTPNTTTINGLEIRIKPRVTSFNAWEKSYLDEKMEFGYDFNGGENILGDTVTREVKPYEIVNADTGEEVQKTIATVLVLGNDTSSNWELLVRSTFKSKGFMLADEVENPVVAEYSKESAKVVATL